jgi:putative N-6 DNA methylase
MKKINIQDWKEFKINSIFDIKRPASRSVKKYDEGNIPFVSSGNYNNGIDSYRIPLNNELLDEGNCITVSPVDGSTFYQETDFLGRGGGGSSILLLYNQNINKDVGLFLSTVIRSTLTRKYQYNDMGSSESIKEEYIKLPVDINGEPDWEYMERYVKQLYARERESSDHVTTYVEKSKLHKIDIKNWKEFTLPELSLEIIKPNVFHSREIKESNESDISYIVRTKFNNGIKCYVEKTDSVEINPSGVITFGAENATFFYQKKPFISGRDIYYIDTRSLNEKSCLFLVSCLQKITDKYTYSNGLFPKDLIKEKIKLPVKSDNSPDWEYMENYMKKLETSLKNMMKANNNSVNVS